MKLLWEERAWEDYCNWQRQDKKTLKRINSIIKDIQRDRFDGTGKPESLKTVLVLGGADESTTLIESFIVKKMGQLSLPHVKGITTIKH